MEGSGTGDSTGSEEKQVRSRKPAEQKRMRKPLLR
jgi:hypothetical protein